MIGCISEKNWALVKKSKKEGNKKKICDIFKNRNLNNFDINRVVGTIVNVIVKGRKGFWLHEDNDANILKTSTTKIYWKLLHSAFNVQKI